MKIVVSAGSLIWDGEHPSLRQFGDEVIVFSRQQPEELPEAVGEDRNILVLTDNDPGSFYPYKVLAASFKSRRIHLFACVPFSYESSRKKQEIRELLTDMSMVKSLCLMELDSFLKDMGLDEKMDHLQARIREAVTARLLEAVPAIRTGTDEFAQYLYDAEKKEYCERDLSDMDGLLSKIPALAGKRPAVCVPERPEEPVIEGISSDAPGGTVSEGIDLEPEEEIRSEEIRSEGIRSEKTEAGPVPGKKRRPFLDFFKRKKHSGNHRML